MKKLLLVLFSLTFLTGCGIFGDANLEPCSDGFHLQDDVCVEDFHPEGSFTSEDDIFNLVQSFQEKRELVGFNRGWVFAEDVAMEMDGAEAPTADNDQGSDDYSETNNQVEGVDEMDNVLTDGKYIYIANYDKIQIALAYTMGMGTDALSLVEEITFDELQGENEYFYFNGMYVDDDRLLVIGNSYEYSCTDYIDEEGEKRDDSGDVYYECYWYEYHSSTLIFEYSLEDFELLNEYELSGNFIGSRKIGDAVYFVTNEYIPVYMMDNENYDFTLDTYLPSYRVNTTDIAMGYEDIMYVEGTEPRNFTTFFGINLDTQEVSTEVVLGEGGYNLYVSTTNIYLTGTKWNWNDAVMLEMEEARKEDNDEYVPEDDPYEIMTSIIRVSIDGGVVDYAAEGDVHGIGLDQFAMDEKDGYVRIVTTEQNWWWWGWDQATEDNVDNRLMVLDMDLNIVSMLDDIGKPGESVQSVRFVGDYAYVVTFLRTDPFYVIDVSDPENPTTLSELEIPGFSDYLQPIGEDYILGIGYGDNDGGTNGLKISLYDVSDKSNAVVASEIVYPYSEGSYMWTSTVYNHKDLLVALDKGIIALPYTLNEWGEYEDDYWWSYRTGVLVLNINLENGEISERGRVEHSATNSYDTYVYKSKFISDYLYTISSKYIKVSTLADPETILNELLIGTPIDIEIPGEVEPVDPEVNPDPECPDGDLNEDGTCTDSTGSEEGFFRDFHHAMSWDEALTYSPEDFLIYVYSDNCDLCEDVNEYMIEFAQTSDLEVIFLNLSTAEESDDMIDAYPALVLVKEMAVDTESIGVEDILTYIN